MTQDSGIQRTKETAIIWSAFIARPHRHKSKGCKEMNEPMSESYKKAVEEFKKWVENSLGRSEDFRKGISPRPKYEPSIRSMR